MNESMPKFLVELVHKRINLLDKKVAVLGYAFKKDTDDARDSLVPKLIRYLLRNCVDVVSVHDPLLPVARDNGLVNDSLEDALEGSQVIFLAVIHSQFMNDLVKISMLCQSNSVIVDLWASATLAA
eukprot:gene20768-24895_t